jgi:phage/plasmid-like protein (TIGR03299 family)
MPANIEKFYGLREPAWHGIGYVAEDVMSLQEALVAADMDFEFSLEPVFTTVMDESGVTTIPVEGKYANVRRNRATNERVAFGPMSQRFANHDLHALWHFAEDFMGEGAVIDTIGTLGRGEKAFMTMQLPLGFELGGVADKNRMLLTATTGFDGSTATQYLLSGIRVVCANTWRMAEDMATNKIKFRHNSTLEGNEWRAAEAMGMAQQYNELLESKAAELLSVSIRDEDAAQVVATLFPLPEGVDIQKMKYDDLTRGQKNATKRAQNKRARVFSLYKDSPAAAEHGTGWGLFNAVTEYADHYAFASKDEWVAADKVLSGELDSLKDQAARLILAGV